MSAHACLDAILSRLKLTALRDQLDSSIDETRRKDLLTRALTAGSSSVAVSVAALDTVWGFVSSDHAVQPIAPPFIMRRIPRRSRIIVRPIVEPTLAEQSKCVLNPARGCRKLCQHGD